MKHSSIVRGGALVFVFLLATATGCDLLDTNDRSTTQTPPGALGQPTASFRLVEAITEEGLSSGHFSSAGSFIDNGEVSTEMTFGESSISGFRTLASARGTLKMHFEVWRIGSDYYRGQYSVHSATGIYVNAHPVGELSMSIVGDRIHSTFALGVVTRDPDDGPGIERP